MNKISTIRHKVLQNNTQGRMLRGTLANLYDKGAVTLVQLATIPILTQFWGIEGYGLWLLLMTLPTYIALSDMGVATAAGVILTQAVERKDYNKALAVIQNTIFIVMGTVGVACIFVLGYILWYWINGNNIGIFSSNEITIAALFILLYSLIFTQMNIITIVWRATHKYASAMMYAGTCILIEGLIIVVMATAGNGIAEVTFAFFITRLISYILFLFLIKKHEKWLEIKFNKISRNELKSLFSPSVAALALMLGIALSIQGVTLVVGMVVAVASAGVYGAVRTLVRAPLQISGLVIRPSIPELTRAYTNKNLDLVKKINTVNLKFTIYTLLPFGILFLLWGDKIIYIVSNGNIVASKTLFFMLFLGVLFHSIWNSLAASLISLNQQAKFAYIYMILIILSIVLIFFLKISEIEKIALIMIVPEILIALIVYFKMKVIS